MLIVTNTFVCCSFISGSVVFATGLEGSLPQSLDAVKTPTITKKQKSSSVMRRVGGWFANNPIKTVFSVYAAVFAGVFIKIWKDEMKIHELTGPYCKDENLYPGAFVRQVCPDIDLADPAIKKRVESRGEWLKKKMENSILEEGKWFPAGDIFMILEDCSEGILPFLKWGRELYDKGEPEKARVVFQYDTLHKVKVRSIKYKNKDKDIFEFVLDQVADSGKRFPYLSKEALDCFSDEDRNRYYSLVLSRSSEFSELVVGRIQSGILGVIQGCKNTIFLEGKLFCRMWFSDEKWKLNQENRGLLVCVLNKMRLKGLCSGEDHLSFGVIFFDLSNWPLL